MCAQVSHLDGHRVQIGSKGVTRPGEVRRFTGEGMPVFERGSKGDLVVTFSVAFPKAVSEAQAKQLQAMFAKTTWHDEL